MEAFFVSTGVVALGEIGDKTQLLALLLATRFKKPVAISLGIFAATLVNHACAAAVGQWVTTHIGADVMRWILGLSFIAMAAWMLIPDKIDEEKENKSSRFGAFFTTVIAFFFVEMGDKTQIATVALAAKYSALGWVVAGTTTGMLLADVPVVFFGERLTRVLPLHWVHRISAAIFVILGLITLFSGSHKLG